MPAAFATCRGARGDCVGALFLEHLSVQAAVDLGLVDAAAVHAVNEEQAQNLHAARPQLEPAIQMVNDGTADLGAFDDLLVDIARVSPSSSCSRFWHSTNS